MSILANTMSSAGVPVEILSVPTGNRTTFNINAVNTGAEAVSLSLFAVPRTDVRVTSFAVTAGGNSYVAIPQITVFGGGGAGAIGSVVMTVDSIALADAGTGYAVDDVLTVTAPQGSGATFTVTDVDGTGAIQSASLTTGGGYTELPASPSAVTGGGGSGATFVLTYEVAGIETTQGGGGYTDPPSVTFSTGSALATTTIGAVVQTKHIIEHATSLDVSGVLYRTALVLGPGDKLFVQADSDAVAISAWGVEALV